VVLAALYCIWSRRLTTPSTRRWSARTPASPGPPPPANPPAPRIPRCEKPYEPGSGHPTP